MKKPLKDLITCFGVLHFLLVFNSNASTPLSENDNTIPVDNSNLIQTISGPVVGIKSKTFNDKVVNIYYGIPYAIPPVGELRFQPPRLTKPWTSTLQAVEPALVCYQDSTDDLASIKELRLMAQRPWSEDCLVLNIWTPDPKPEGAKVVVFIHGGAYIVGSSIIEGTTFALEGLIVVSMNYRLGVFGFLGFGQPDAPGNVGLMDQNMAMQWVKNNIEAFGGDPNDITLMGMSAGSGSVGFHLLSPMSKGLFQRSIMMSGAPTSWWGIREPEESVAKAKSLSRKLGCSSENVTEVLGCLRTKHPEDILDASRSKNLMVLEHFIPTVDGNFIVEHPSVSVIAGRFHPGEVILGTSKDEGEIFMLLLNPEVTRTKDGRLRRNDFLNVIKRLQKGLSNLQVEVLNVMYTNWTNPDDPIMLRNAASHLYSDGIFICHVNNFADNLFKSGNTVYRYVYDRKYDAELLLILLPDWVGVSHGSDGLPVVGPQAMFRFFSPADIEFTQLFVSHFANFIKTGNPNLSAKEFPDEPEWPRYTANQEYKVFSKESSIHNHPRARECAVWMNLLPIVET